LETTAFTILLLGITCLAAAAVGGGLKIYKAEFPLIASVRRQILLATVGGLAVGLSLVLFFGKPDGGAGGNHAASRSSKAQASFSRQPESESASAKAEPGTVFWKGEREFEGSGTSYDLDALPGTREGDDDLSYDSQSRTLDLSYAPESAAWPGPGSPTSADCRSRVRTHREQNIKVQPGTMACLVTDQNHVAAIRVKKLVIRDGKEALVAEVTVWNAE
jgi:hypothetical protein